MSGLEGGVLTVACAVLMNSERETSGEKVGSRDVAAAATSGVRWPVAEAHAGVPLLHPERNWAGLKCLLEKGVAADRGRMMLA